MKAKKLSKLNIEKRTPLQEVIPLSTPYLLYVDPSSACNFRCQFCPSGHHDLIEQSGYRRGVMSYELFEKIIEDLHEFDAPLKVMRFNKVGEPLLNQNLCRMIDVAKKSGRVQYIDLATNGSLFSRELLSQLVTAGLDRLNISLEGINREQYRLNAKVDIDFKWLVETIKWFYPNRTHCEVTIKVPGNYLSEDEKKLFFDTFGDYCDRIFIEDIAPIWPSFDVENRANTTVSTAKGQYKQVLEEKEVCTYIFYGAAINADGTVSACCPDWEQKLIVGDVRTHSLKTIWNSDPFNLLRRQHLEGKRHENPTCSVCGHIKYSQVDNIDDFRGTILPLFL